MGKICWGGSGVGQRTKSESKLEYGRANDGYAGEEEEIASLRKSRSRKLDNSVLIVRHDRLDELAVKMDERQWPSVLILTCHRNGKRWWKGELMVFDRVIGWGDYGDARQNDNKTRQTGRGGRKLDEAKLQQRQLSRTLCGNEKE